MILRRQDQQFHWLGSIKFVYSTKPVGETLVDEIREWAEWADFLGLSRLTFFAALGAVIARSEHHRRVFRLVRPDSDFQQLQQQREQAGKAYRLHATDLYPDAVPCLRRLRQAGNWWVLRVINPRW